MLTCFFCSDHWNYNSNTPYDATCKSVQDSMFFVTTPKSSNKVMPLSLNGVRGQDCGKPSEREGIHNYAFFNEHSCHTKCDRLQFPTPPLIHVSPDLMLGFSTSLFLN